MRNNKFKTPRCDAEVINATFPDLMVVPYSFARQLEIEINILKLEIKLLGK